MRKHHRKARQQKLNEYLRGLKADVKEPLYAMIRTDAHGLGLTLPQDAHAPPQPPQPQPVARAPHRAPRNVAAPVAAAMDFDDLQYLDDDELARVLMRLDLNERLRFCLS